MKGSKANVSITGTTLYGHDKVLSDRVYCRDLISLYIHSHTLLYVGFILFNIMKSDIRSIQIFCSLSAH